MKLTESKSKWVVALKRHVISERLDISHTSLKLLRFCRPSIIYWSLMWSLPVNSARWKQFSSPFIPLTAGVWRWGLRRRTACVCVCAVECSLRAGFLCWRSLLHFSFVLVLLLLLKRPPYWICSLTGLRYIKCLTFSAPHSWERHQPTGVY